MKKSIETATKKEYIEFMKYKINTDPEWSVKALVTVYHRQNRLEKETCIAVGHDKAGFNKVDCGLLNKITKKFLVTRKLSAYELRVVQDRMPKYAGQLYKIAKEKMSKQKQLHPRIKPGIRDEVRG